jgi:hypothetical protein
VVALLNQARQLYESGNTAGAFKLVETARGLDTSNPEPEQQIDRWLAAAGSTASEARKRAETMDTAHATFREADGRRLAAEQHLRAGRKTQAIDAFTAAARLFREVPPAVVRRVDPPPPGPDDAPRPIQPRLTEPEPPVEAPKVEGKPITIKPAPPIDTGAERQAVLGVLREFADGYNSMNLGAIQKIYPSVETQVYSRTFSSFSALDWRYDNPVITLSQNGTEAEVNTQVTIVQTPRRGRQLPPDRRIKRIVLRKQAQGWVIVENVDVGPAR